MESNPLGGMYGGRGHGSAGPKFRTCVISPKLGWALVVVGL